MVPTVALPPVTLLTDHTGVADDPVTVAVNCRVAPVATLAEAGDTVTVTGGGAWVTVTAAVSFAPEAVSVARTVTAPEGTAAGAV